MIYLLLFAISLLFSACQPNQPHTPKTTMFSSQAMTIDYKIIIGKNLTNDEAKKVQTVIQNVFTEVDRHYNNWNPDSEISGLNKLSAGETQRLSPQLAALLNKTDEIVHLTEGRFDPTIRPLHLLWKTHLDQGQLPSEESILEATEGVGWENIHIKGDIFYKDFDRTSIDLGGIAKGYCVDLLVEGLNGAGFSNVYVEWGGEIRTSGEHPEGRPWTIFISRLGNPDPSASTETLQISDKAIATSGDYMQFWMISEDSSNKPTVYFHIINPLTKRPLEATRESIASASVIADTCLIADGLATAAMMFDSIEKAKAWADLLAKKLPGTEFYFITRLKSHSF